MIKIAKNEKYPQELSAYNIIHNPMEA